MRNCASNYCKQLSHKRLTCKTVVPPHDEGARFLSAMALHLCSLVAKGRKGWSCPLAARATLALTTALRKQALTRSISDCLCSCTSGPCMGRGRKARSLSTDLPCVLSSSSASSSKRCSACTTSHAVAKSALASSLSLDVSGASGLVRAMLSCCLRSSISCSLARSSCCKARICIFWELTKSLLGSLHGSPRGNCWMSVRSAASQFVSAHCTPELSQMARARRSISISKRVRMPRPSAA
mmetsp:Transcript_8589/g.20194  ORF Transcript_8589/g.20194 Transcript_8589/m.20194 type:complete len:239 (+) Transcript_8589:394-1110(+)